MSSADGSVDALLRHRRHGPGLGHRHGADGRRGAQRPGRGRCGSMQRDTDVTPYDMGTLGSRSLFHMGHAVRSAAEEARDKLKQLAQRGRRAGGLQHADRRAVPEALRHAGRQCHRHGHLQARLCAARAGHRQSRRTSRRSGWSRARAPRWRSTPRPATSRSPSSINVVDCGKAVNPKIVETQISGAALMHVGFTHVREDAYRRRPGDQRIARRLQDSRASTTCR